MKTSMRLDIVSVEAVLYAGDAHFVVVPGKAENWGSIRITRRCSRGSGRAS